MSTRRPIISIRTYEPMGPRDHGMIEVMRGGETYDDITTKYYIIPDHEHYVRTWNRVDDAAYSMGWGHHSTAGMTVYTRQQPTK